MVLSDYIPVRSVVIDWNDECIVDVGYTKLCVVELASVPYSDELVFVVYVLMAQDLASSELQCLRMNSQDSLLH